MTRFFDAIPDPLFQKFSRIRRSSALGQDTYGDATFTEQTSTGYKGFVQFGQKPGEIVIISGKEIHYDGMVYTSATMLVSESDFILFGSSQSTSIATRYIVTGIVPVYERGAVDHKEIYIQREIV